MPRLPSSPMLRSLSAFGDPSPGPWYSLDVQWSAFPGFIAFHGTLPVAVIHLVEQQWAHYWGSSLGRHGAVNKTRPLSACFLPSFPLSRITSHHIVSLPPMLHLPLQLKALFHSLISADACWLLPLSLSSPSLRSSLSMFPANLWQQTHISHTVYHFDHSPCHPPPPPHACQVPSVSLASLRLEITSRVTCPRPPDPDWPSRRVALPGSVSHLPLPFYPPTLSLPMPISLPSYVDVLDHLA